MQGIQNSLLNCLTVDAVGHLYDSTAQKRSRIGHMSGDQEAKNPSFLQYRTSHKRKSRYYIMVSIEMIVSTNDSIQIKCATIDRIMFEETL